MAFEANKLFDGLAFVWICAANDCAAKTLPSCNLILSSIHSGRKILGALASARITKLHMSPAPKAAMPVTTATPKGSVGETIKVAVANIAQHESSVLAPPGAESAMRDDTLDSSRSTKRALQARVTPHNTCVRILKGVREAEIVIHVNQIYRCIQSSVAISNTFLIQQGE